MQSLDYCERTLEMEPFCEKWKAFGWKVIEIDGNDHKDLKMAFEKAKLEKEKPTVIIANTIKGKGISFMEKISFGIIDSLTMVGNMIVR